MKFNRQNSLTTLLILAISLCYVANAYLGINLFEKFALAGSGWPQHHEYYRFLTVALVHGGLTHILFNMLALYQLGSIIENALGEVRYVMILFASLLAGSAFSWKFMPPNGVAVGASGMIFGLFGAMLVIGKRVGLNYNAVLGTIILNLALPFFVSNIDWHAHVGGLIGGALATSLITVGSKF